jgi:sodium transport system permease protein
LVISSFARNQKEAQTYILPFFSIVILPAVLSTVLGAESHIFTAFIPILNISLTMKQIFGDLFDPLYFGISLATSFLYAFLAMRLAASFFQREQILFRT